eukprot:1264652-Amphidinium_carterae.1
MLSSRMSMFMNTSIMVRIHGAQTESRLHNPRQLLSLPGPGGVCNEVRGEICVGFRHLVHLLEVSCARIHASVFGLL